MITAMLLSIGAQAAVPPAPPSPPKERVERMIIVHHTSDALGEPRPTVVTRGSSVVISGCNADRKCETQTEVSRDGRTEKTRIMLCAKAGESDVAWVQRLRSAAKRIEADDNLAPEARTKVIAALNEAIAKSPAQE